MSKLTLGSPRGELLARETQANERVEGPGYAALDSAGIEAFVIDTLAKFASQADVGAIIPVAHGASAAIVREGKLVLPPMDYEHPVPADERQAYDTQRDAFALSGSPALPDGLNLGAQLHHLETLNPAALEGATILLWP